MPEPDHQWLLVPNYVDLLLEPISRHAVGFKVKVPKEVGDDEAHFMICKAVSIINIRGSSPRELNLRTYFMPMQFLGPVEKGFMADFLSAAKRGSWPSIPSASQRSGMKESGSTKLYSEW